MTGNRWTVGGVDEGPKLVTGTKFQIPNVSSTPKLLGKKKKKYPEDHEDQSLSNQWQLQRSLTSSQPQHLQHIKNISLLQDLLTTPSVLCWPWWRQNRLMVNLPLSHDRQTLPEHTANPAAGITASVNHLLWSRSLSETFRGATFCQRMRYLGEVIATVVSVTLGRLLTSWNMMRADSRGGKMAPDSHLWIYHLPTRQFGDAELYNYEKDLSMDYLFSYISIFRSIRSLIKMRFQCEEPVPHIFNLSISLALWPLCLHHYNLVIFFFFLDIPAGSCVHV